MTGPDGFFWMIWITAIAGGVIIIIAAMIRRLKIIEMHHKERMAMIERGQVPAPDTSDPLSWIAVHKAARGTRSRTLSGGIVVIGLGLALMMLLGVAVGEPGIAVGMGGAVAIIGAAFVVIALIQGRTVEPPPPPPFPPPPRRDGETS